MSDARATSALDFVLGRKLRAAREEAGLSQQALAARLGITFQQIQKYEKGANRMAASRLVAIAGAVGKPIAYFLEDAKEAAAAGKGAAKNGALLGGADQMSAASFFASIDDKKVRRRVVELLRAIVDAETARESAPNAKAKTPTKKAKKPARSTRR